MADDAKTAGAQYSYWKAPDGDFIDDETVERLRAHHGPDTDTLRCVNCGYLVHAFMGDYREQYAAYVRYGPHAICGECIAREFDLPALQGGADGPWWER